MIIKGIKVGINLFIITGFLIFFSPPLLKAETSAKAKRESEEFHHQFAVYTRFIPSCKVKTQTGEVEIIDSAAEYSYEFKLFDKLPVKFSLENQVINIDNTTAVELPSHLIGLGTDIETTLPFFNFKKTYFRMGLNPSLYSDDWDFESSAFRIPMRYFLIHQPNEKWTFIAGVAVYPDFETQVLPILGFIYKPNDKLIFNLVPERPNITYFLSEKMALFLEGGTALNSEFEVSKDNYKNTVLRYKETRLGSGVEYKLNKYTQAFLTVGGIFNRTLQYKESLGKVNIKNGFYSELRIEMEL